jgi:hypothetical protein
MRIVLNHLTRMEAPRICIAGLDHTSERHVRPTTGRMRPLTRGLLASEGGPFRLGALVDLGEVVPEPTSPETEDCRFTPDRATVLGQLSDSRYLELLHEHARERVHEIFGEQLTRHGRTYAVDEASGAVSLGILRVRRTPSLQIDRFGKLRLRLSVERQLTSLPITDVRLFEADHITIRTDAVEDLRARMRHGIRPLLMLGLSRAFQKEGDDRGRHWLQVNGICMSDRPLAEAP